MKMCMDFQKNLHEGKYIYSEPPVQISWESNNFLGRNEYKTDLFSLFRPILGSFRYARNQPPGFNNLYSIHYTNDANRWQQDLQAMRTNANHCIFTANLCDISFYYWMIFL